MVESGGAGRDRADPASQTDESAGRDAPAVGATPWKSLGQMNDTELPALFLHFHSSEPTPEGAAVASR